LIVLADEHDDDKHDDDCWWWRSEAGKPEERDVLQWVVLAANSMAGWEAGGPKKVRANERDGSRE
jgi:hypothetical protein